MINSQGQVSPMEKQIFNMLVQKVLAHEGGYVNNPLDKGGETNLGISKRFYPKVDIKNLTAAQATEIYYTDYWKRARLDKIAELGDAYTPLVYQLFKAVVNIGQIKAVKLLQKSLGVPADGVLGAATLNAIKNGQNVYLTFTRDLLYFYFSLALADKTQANFLKGLIYRCLS